MNCILCKSNMINGTVNHIVDLDGHIVIVKGVPQMSVSNAASILLTMKLL